MKFTQWMPDGDPTVPGTVTSVENMIPTTRGYRVCPAGVDAGFSALAAACRGAATVQKLNGTRRVFAGADTAIYELSAGAWSDVATPVYTGGAANRWMFAQFGDATLATNDADQIQVSTTGNFAALSTAPKARILFTVPNFVIAMNTQDASGSTAFGDSPDRWWCSGFQDHTVWTPALSTQCASGRLIGQGGQLTAGAKFGSGFVAYKQSEMWLASYVGSPAVFQFDPIPGDQGCVGPEAVVDVGNAHIFVGFDDIWLFDGTRPRSIADGICREYFFRVVNPDYLYRTQLVFDRRAKMVWMFFFGVGATTNADRALVYHLTTGKWGLASIQSQAAFIYTEPGVTWASIATDYPTWESLETQTWDSSDWTSGSTSLAHFDSSNTLKTITDLYGGTGSIAGNWLGTGVVDVLVKTVWPEMYEGAADSVAIFDKAANGAGTAGQTFTVSGYKATPMHTGRRPKVSVTLSGSDEIMGIEVDAEVVGRR